MKGYPKLRIRLAVGMSLLGASLAFGAEYTLGPGETDSITEGTVEYDSATIAGDLSVSGGAYFNVSNITFVGGSVSVSGAGTQFGHTYVEKKEQGKVTIAPGATGEYPTFSVSDGAVSVLQNVTVQAPAEPLPSDTVIDLATIDSANFRVHKVVNNTSCTNRFLFRKSGTAVPRFNVVGIERVNRGDSRFAGSAPFLLEAAPGVDKVYCNMSGGVGRNYYWNAAGTEVLFVGNCTVEFICKSDHTTYPNAGFRFREGAFFNNTGDLCLGCETTGSYRGQYFVDGDMALGPNVRCLKAAAGDLNKNPASVTVAAGKTLTVNNLDFSLGDGGILAGAGTVMINAGAAARTFKGGKVQSGSTLTVAKTGANAATVSGFAWLPSVDVREGDLVFASDTVISNTVTIAEGARLVADGCTVTIVLSAESMGDLLARCVQVNGGRVVLVAAERTVAYDPTALPAVLDLNGGNLVYSGLGIDCKYWRFTYTKMVGASQSMAFGRYWMFDTEGERACTDITYSTTTPVTELTKPDAADLAAGKVRLRVDSTATVTVNPNRSYSEIKRLNHLFKAAFKENSNNYVDLVSPVIDPQDPASWITLELRLFDAAKPITGYNFAKSPAGRYATDWSVYASADGKNWDLVDQRSGVENSAEDPYVFYGETTPFTKAEYVQPVEYFRFTGYRRDSLTPSANPLAVRLDKGATLDLRAFVPAGGQEVNALTVDVAQEVAGVLYGAKLSQTGNVNVIAPTRAAAKGQLPIRLVDLVGDQRLDGWTVSVNGVPTQKTLKLEDDGTVSVDAQGLILLFR